MSFENEEGVNRAVESNQTIENEPDLYGHLGVWLDEFSIEIQQASEPSDIIWENRHFTPTDRLKKKIVVFFTILILLLLSFVLIYVCSSYSLKLLKVYPSVTCGDLPGTDSAIELEQSAIREWSINNALK